MWVGPLRAILRTWRQDALALSARTSMESISYLNIVIRLPKISMFRYTTPWMIVLIVLRSVTMIKLWLYDAENRE